MALERERLRHDGAPPDAIPSLAGHAIVWCHGR